MTTTILPVRREDIRPLISLEVAPDQLNFVASNAVTLAQAPYETGAHVFGIWAGTTLVGLLAAVDNRDYQFAEPEDDPNSVFLWRLMIGRDHQGHGYGRAAMLRMFDWVKDRGLQKVFTSVVEGNNSASSFYTSLGFDFTGRLLNGEAEMLLVLK